MLELRNICKKFGGVTALNDVSFSVNDSEILGLIGPNGAGKTTLFNLVTGALVPSSGEIFLNGESLLGLKPHKIAQKGVIVTFQATTLFMAMTALQNVIVGLYMKSKKSLGRILYSKTLIPEEEIGMASAILDLIHLGEFKNRLAGELPHGMQRMLGVGIALACEPRVLLMDEPVSGMNRDEKEVMKSLIKVINAKGTTILLVEHDMRTVMDLSGRIIVLNFGVKIGEGTPEEIRGNRDVVEAYLGPEVAGD